ncbi:MAG TPA: bifunctional 2-C-methyl-D-erythritol 4-phosphate cytidylyltransferase/2-C-methyl-D-erythritol 2,4-cyclodiphosphate synthase, partial [Erythrobacter sp.]|nr:bifunctional 2-C-methyl-D-erythritol 4-phosphate cytidylyltransferase/2-C-methyl-D-erythritol 2,4-cyclodiphosphate synthase [Erythrobacter sp.]
IAIPENGEAAAHTALDGLAGYTLVAGGVTRQQSVARALSAIESADTVLIHDAARPDLPPAVIERLLGALETHAGAIP